MSSAAELSGFPGPYPEGRRLLFLLDAGNSLEKRILGEWLDAMRNSGQPSSDVQQLVIPISKGDANLNTAKLATMLAGPDETLLVPLRVVWLPEKTGQESKPRFRDLIFGDPRQPNILRAKWILSSKPHLMKRIAGAEASIEQLRERFDGQESSGRLKGVEEFSEFVLRQASLALDVAERRLQGGRYKVPRFVAESLRASPKFNNAIAELAQESGRPIQALQEESEGYLKEMVARPTTFFIDLWARLAKAVVSLGYESEIRYDPAGLDRAKRFTRDHPTLLLFTHKSHVDGMALSSFLYSHDFSWPHTLGGVNMAFAGAGFIGRRSGAIFIRRSFQDNPVYKLVLRQYLGYLMEKRFPLSWAFEGTRSRVGKLMPPRYGLLKYTLEAAYATKTENLHIIPVAINFDMIGEVEDYAVQEAGKTKRAESLQWFIGYLRSLRRPMGKIYLDFAKPVVLDKAPPPGDSLALTKIAFDIGVNANQVTPVTLPSLMAMILLGAAPQALTVDEVTNHFNQLIQWLQQRNIRMAHEVKQSDQGLALLMAMVQNGLVNRYTEGRERVYGIDQDKHSVVSYYRNTIIHYFVNKAIIELALLKVTESDQGSGDETVAAFWAETESLRNLFKFEFFYAAKEQFQQEIADELALHNPQWETELGRGGDAILSLLKSGGPLVAHATLLHFIEAYTVVADLLARLQPGESLDESDCVSQALKYGRQAYMQRRISSEASIGKLFFTNAYKLAENLQLTDDSDTSVEKRVAFFQELKDLSVRVAAIRSLSMSSIEDVAT